MLAALCKPSPFSVLQKLNIIMAKINLMFTDLRFSGTEEALESVSGLFGSLFREKVPCVQCVSLNFIAPGPPERDGPALLDIPSSKRSGSTPQDQERTDDPTLARTIRLVMFTIDGCRSSILLTDGVRVLRISKNLHIGSADLWLEQIGRASCRERVEI